MSKRPKTCHRVLDAATFTSGFLRAFWCSRGKHVRSPFAASRDQIHHRFRLCCDSFFTWILLRSFRHHFRTIGRTEMANVKQTQKMIPFITCEISFWLECRQVGSWCQCTWFGFLGPKLILSNNQSRATLWVLETCLIVGLLPLFDHLDHCFVVFKHLQQSFLMRRLDVWGNKINIVQITDHSLRLFSFLNCVRCRTNFTFVL